MGDGNSYGKSLCWVSVDENLGKEVTFHVEIFNFFSSHVLPLLQFKDIFLSIDDADWLARSWHHADITSEEPSIFVDGLFCFDFVVVVAHENTRTSSPDLSSRCYPSFFVFICTQVVHFGDIHQLYLDVGDWASHMSHIGIICWTEKKCSCWLGLPIAFNQRCTEDYFEELLNFRQEWSTSWNHKSASSSQCLLRFSEENSIVDSMFVWSILFKVCKFDTESILKSTFSPSLKFTEFLFQNIIKSREKSWNTQEDSRFDNSQIIFQLLHIPREVYNTSTFVPHSIIELSLKNVGQRKVRKTDIIMGNAGVWIALLGCHEGSKIFMRNHGAFWWASGSRSVWEGQAIIRRYFVLFTVVVNRFILSQFRQFRKRNELDIYIKKYLLFSLK